jgi:glycosyltransferase involved in cell wall biosynthesis
MSNLIVLPWSPELPGGVSVVARNLTRVWNAAGVPTSILVSDWPSKRLRIDASGTAFIKLAIVAKSSMIGLLKGALSAPLILWRTLSMLKQLQVGTVYFHYTNLDAVGIALLRRLNLFQGSLVLCFHGTDVRKPANRLESWLWRFVFDAADVVTACSHSLARTVEATFGLADGRVGAVYNGVDMTIFSQAAHPDAGGGFASPFPRYVVSVGGFIERKGHIYLLEAFAQVSHRFPGLGLIIVGMDGKQRAVLEERVDALGMQESVRFLVNLQPRQVAEVVAGAMLCVQPSLAEPFGMAVTEAGALGVCVAASEVGGHLELISHRQTGFLFAPADAGSIAALLVDVLSDDALRAQVARNFQVKVTSTLTWEACADRYRRLACSNRGEVREKLELG